MVQLVNSFATKAANLNVSPRTHIKAKHGRLVPISSVLRVETDSGCSMASQFREDVEVHFSRRPFLCF